MLVGPLLPVGLVERDGAREGKYVEITGTEGKKKTGMKSKVYCYCEKMAVVVVLVIKKKKCAPHSKHHYSGVRAPSSVMWGVEKRGSSFHFQFSPHFYACPLDFLPIQIGVVEK